MGYRSDVRFVTTSEGYKRFKSHIPEKVLDPDYGLFDERGETEAHDEYNDTVVFGWNYVKWYEGTDWGYEDVRAVMKAYRDTMAEGYPFEYMRLGEEYDDVDFRRSDNNEVLALHLDLRQEIYVW